MSQVDVAPPHDTLALPIRLDLDRRALRDTVTARATAALITIVGSVWLAATQNHWSLALVAALTGVFAIVWLARGLHDHMRALDESHHVLLSDEGIVHQTADRTIELGWDSVASVAVDEDRLVVTVECRDRPALTLEPTFGGLGVYDLRDVISRAQTAALRRAPHAADASRIERA